MRECLFSLAIVGEPASNKFDLLGEQGITLNRRYPGFAAAIGIEHSEYTLDIDGIRNSLMLKAIDHKFTLIPRGYYMAHAAIATYTAPDDINKLTLQTQLAKFYENARGAAPATFWPFSETNQEFETDIAKQFPDKPFLFSQGHSINERLENLVRKLNSKLVPER